MQIVINNGSVEYDGEPVLTEIDFAIRDNEKIAVVGRNGCGKTTLLRALTGEVDMIKGTGESDFGFYKTGSPVVGCLKQTFEADDDRTLEEELLTAYSDLLETERDMASALEAVERDGSEENARAYSRLHERYEQLGGYTYQTDDLGRIIMAGGVLQKKDHTGRGNMPDQMTAGSKAQNFSGDQRGHLIADMFNASGGMENFVAMDAHLNQVRYRSLEMKLAALVNDPAHDNQVSYFVRPVYHGGSYRPVGFAVEYTVNGEQFSERFYNGSLR